MKRGHPANETARTTGPGRLCAWLALVCALAGLSVAHAANKIEGYYETEIAAERTDNKWHFGQPGSNAMPKHYAELKFFSWPSDDFEAFVKLRAEANRDDDRTSQIDFYAPPWLIAEGHLRLKAERYEVMLFSRQNRFWINSEPLLSLVEDHKLKNDDWGPKSQGVRFDFWGLGLEGDNGLYGSIIYSDDGATYNWDEGEGDILDGADSWIVRLMPEFAPDLFGGREGGLGRAELGFTLLRKDWTDTSNPEYRDLHHLMHNSIYAVDLAYSPTGIKKSGLFLGPINLEQSRWTVEYAVSQEPFREKVFGESSVHNHAFAAEMRDIQMKNLILHSWYFDFGENFRDYLSGRFDNDRREFNRIQKHVELIWLLPRKAVTAKVVYDTQRKRFRDEIGGGLRPSEEWYGELYTEFVNGFKGKIAYKQWRGYDASAEVNDFFTYPEWFAEVSVENFLAKIRMQMRLRDVGTFRELTAFGFDMNVNITERLKGYLRMMNVNEQTEARHTMFAQLKYDLGFGAEFFFEYGDAGQSDNIVRTDWFVDEGNGDLLRDRLKLFFKSWF